MLRIACLSEHGLQVQSLEVQAHPDLLILGRILNPLTSASSFMA